MKLKNKLKGKKYFQAIEDSDESLCLEADI